MKSLCVPETPSKAKLVLITGDWLVGTCTPTPLPSDFTRIHHTWVKRGTKEQSAMPKKKSSALRQGSNNPDL